MYSDTEGPHLSTRDSGSGSESDQPDPAVPFVPHPPSVFPAASGASTPRDDSAIPTPYSDPYQPSGDLLASSEGLTNRVDGIPQSKELDAAEASAASDAAARRYTKRPFYTRPLFWLVAFILLVVVVLAVVLPVYFLVVKKHNHSNASSSSSSGSSNGPLGTPPNTPLTATSGGNGTTVTMQDGSTFTYINPFGGYWVSDPSDPWNNTARVNSWTPALSENWTWGQDRVNGVNLGGLFVLEPFITPALFQANPGAVDEWTLSTALAGNGTLQQTLEQHYDTFITEQDIAEIAGAGLNWIRVPLPFWAINTWSNVGVDATGAAVAEPFLARTCWNYFLRVVGWARKYGLRVNLDLHTIPGSQNGYNHSGKLGVVNFLNGPMGLANAERALDYIRILTEFITQPEYAPVIPMFGIVNEALLSTIGKDQLITFYLHAYDMIREITGVGEGKGPFISIHDGFQGAAYWAGTLTGSDRVALDTHMYFAFDGSPNGEPVAVPANGNANMLGGQWPLMACNAWGPQANTSQTAFGVTYSGEFSNGMNDCGLYVNGVGQGSSSAANCTLWSDAALWNETTREGVRTYALASMDALQDWFFWTWKIGNSSTSNSVEAPLWSYQLGLQYGFMPTDPREAIGTCAALGGGQSPFDGEYASWQTGGAGAGTIAATSVATYGVWPPTTMAGVPAQSVLMLPQYTGTAGVSTLPAPTALTSVATVPVGSGWYDAGDTASAVTTISGCTYPDAWYALSSAIPTAGCGAVSYGAAVAPVLTSAVAAATTTSSAPAAAAATSAPARRYGGAHT
ncbi:Probable glucan 1,3-beta-glucosidase [Sparassis crispa]|uniref:glucan 1,3-beta-glucosidase n=1 Tax=Sparassis crispa TaxID=139825 RepID=A0A401GFD5_9APHY|nr:Probable glucan 1,3-beta-glucosidase [Sparassis crispa]GBE80896.1 Probable glucan 1,3-beta-glucosidase [Sparassis crispa]